MVPPGRQATEVVQSEPARDVLGDHMRQRQLGEQRPHSLLWQAGEASRGGGGDVRPPVQPWQPEQPRRGGG